MIKSNSSTKTDIPSGWEVKKLGEIGEVISGLTYKPEMISDDGILVLRSSNVQNRQLAYDNNVFVEAKDLKYNPVKNGDILICVRNGSRSLIGKNAKINDTSEGVAFGAFMSVFRSKHNDYLFHVFDTDLYNKEIHVNLGATINSINSNDLKQFKIPLPPLTEQRAIANILSTWDIAIQTTQELISQKEEEKKWLMQNLLTGQKRLKGFSVDWKKVGAGEVFESFTKKGFENEELLSATQDRGIIPRSMLSGRVTMPDGSTSGYKLVVPGDFIISLRSFQGGLEYSYYRGIVSPAYIVLKPKELIDDEFYKQYFKSWEFIGRLATAVIGIRDGKQISYDDFCIVKIPNPSLEEQTAISQVLQTADREIELLNTKLKQQKLQKKGLMQMLLTGKVRVSGKLEN